MFFVVVVALSSIKHINITVTFNLVIGREKPSLFYADLPAMQGERMNRMLLFMRWMEVSV